MKTTAFKMVLGINEGYDNNKNGGMATSSVVELVAEKFQLLATKTYERYNEKVYISGTIVPGVVSYHKEWGCPTTGETVVIIEGVRNPLFLDNDYLYREAVRMVGIGLKHEFKQSTITIEFSEREVTYLS